MNRWPLYLRWVAANSLAELLGLGATFALDVLIFTRLGEPKTVLAAVGIILLTTSTGVFEGTLVGLLQWSALRRPFTRITRSRWLVATLSGALVAWFLGSVPSTVMGLGSDTAGSASQEPQAWLMMLLAASMGLVLGLILALPQWRVLRQVAHRAWVWLPANGVAWALGMPLVFTAVDLAYRAGTTSGAIAVMAAALAIVGALVGAVHGLALVWLAGQANAAGDSQHTSKRSGRFEKAA